MPGFIVSANVGNAVAGGVVIPQATPAAYATWPDILKKTTQDITAIFLDRLERGGEDPDEDRVQPAGTSPGSTPAVARAAVFSLPVLIIAGLFAYLLFARR